MKKRVNEYFANITEFEGKCVEINDEEERLWFCTNTPTLDEAKAYLIRIINYGMLRARFM